MAMNPRLLVPRATFDPDAAAYLRAVEAADGQALETPVKRAVDDFFRGCKADGIWGAIKASCILCGARTISGALVPLVGAAPTNNNFVDADYNRETGLIGDGSTKYLDSNRNNNADPQNSQHMTFYASALRTSGFVYIGTGDDTAGTTHFVQNLPAGQVVTRNRSSSASTLAVPNAGFLGMSRAGSANYTVRISGFNTTVSISSQSPFNGNVFVFGANDGTGLSAGVDARLAFYSIGSSLDLAALDARVTTLIAAIGAAI